MRPWLSTRKFTACIVKMNGSYPLVQQSITYVITYIIGATNTLLWLLRHSQQPNRSVHSLVYVADLSMQGGGTSSPQQLSVLQSRGVRPAEYDTRHQHCMQASHVYIDCALYRVLW